MCTASPKYGKAFCDEHLQYLTRNHPNIPTDLRGFLAYCGIQRSEAEIGNNSLITVIWILWINIDWLVYSFVYICCVLLGRDNMMFQSCYKIKESVLGPKEARYSYGQKLFKYKICNCQQSVTIFNNTIPLNGDNRNLGKANLLIILVSGLLVL